MQIAELGLARQIRPDICRGLHITLLVSVFLCLPELQSVERESFLHPTFYDGKSTGCSKHSQQRGNLDRVQLWKADQAERLEPSKPLVIGIRVDLLRTSGNALTIGPGVPDA